MKIQLEKHSAAWNKDFEGLKKELTDCIGFANPRIEHIGSTSVEGLAAKPIIDILIGLENESVLEKVIEPLLEQGYIYYQIYNTLMPYRRFFIKHKAHVNALNIPGKIQDEKEIPHSTEEHALRLAHIHILKYNSEHWIRHMAFRDYLRAHSTVRAEYQELKEKLSLKEWPDGNDYNKAKDPFLKREEKKAVHWYLKFSNSLSENRK